jgi:hypothetical protein
MHAEKFMLVPDIHQGQHPGLIQQDSVALADEFDWIPLARLGFLPPGRTTAAVPSITLLRTAGGMSIE